jgi:quinol monooxygenase YgiN
MPKFIQFVEFSTDYIARVRELAKEWEEDTVNTRTALSTTIVQDRNAPEWYVAIVTFPSYEAAMENSGLLATQHFAQKMQDLCKEGPKFCDLDVLEESDLSRE